LIVDFRHWCFGGLCDIAIRQRKDFAIYRRNRVHRHRRLDAFESLNERILIPWLCANSIENRTLSLFFYAGDRDEPAHIHVERDDMIAKYWLEPLRLQSSGGFSRLETWPNSENSNEKAKRVVGGLECVLPRLNRSTGCRKRNHHRGYLSVDKRRANNLCNLCSWYPRLLHASQKERKSWRLIGKGQGIHWEGVDEDVSVEGCWLASLPVKACVVCQLACSSEVPIKQAGRIVVRANVGRKELP